MDNQIFITRSFRLIMQRRFSSIGNVYLKINDLLFLSLILEALMSVITNFCA